MAEPFRYYRLVEFADTDAAGIAHFTSLIRFMESAEHAFLRSMDSSVMDAATRRGRSDQAFQEHPHLSWPRVKLDVEFKAAAFFEDELEIDVRVMHLGRSSVRYTMTVLERVSRNIVAVGHMTVVCCRVVPGKPLESIDIPAYLRTKMEAYLVSADN